MVAYIWNLSLGASETREYNASPGYIVRFCLKREGGRKGGKKNGAGVKAQLVERLPSVQQVLV